MNILSGYYPVVTFRDDAENYLRTTYLDSKIKSFFEEMNISYYYEIDQKDLISPLDFRKIDFGYFYKTLLEKNMSKGSGQLYVSYGLTFDKEITPQFCDKTGTHFEIIKLGSTPIFYYIYVDLNYILHLLKKHAFTIDPRRHW